MNRMTIVRHLLNNNTRTGLVISLFKCKYFNQSDSPKWPQILDVYSVVVLWGLMLTKYYALIN